ncbi:MULTISPECIES: hypothetical protein [Emticicia]|uniref:hypothetical protein n=1 Tax=Emticicia TaxID=312278 RepID=UPI0007D8CA44|nr:MULTISPECIES: hypothetical protein [Emticicia]
MIWVFKTTIKNKRQVKQIAPILNELIVSPSKWNFDLEDCDKILRVENYKIELQEDYLIQRLLIAGYNVEVLE